jgi:hypothetical protein
MNSQDAKIHKNKDITFLNVYLKDDSTIVLNLNIQLWKFEILNL